MVAMNPAIIGILLKTILEDPTKAAASFAGAGATVPTIASQPAPFPLGNAQEPGIGQPASVPGGGGGGGLLGGVLGGKETTTAVPSAPSAPGVNPLEALQAPQQAQPLPAPAPRSPGLGGQLNPQILQLLLQSLQGGVGAGGGAPANQSLGAILGQRR